MKYNPNIKTTHWFVENDMILEQNHSWNSDGDFGKGDAIGRTTKGYFTYRDPKLIEGIKRCWIKIEACLPYYEDCSGKEDDYYYRGQRFNTPDYYHKDMSRDHTIMTMIAMLIANDPFAEELANHIRYTIREGSSHKFTLTLWCWFKIFAKKRWAKSTYFFLMFWEVLAYRLVNWFAYKRARFSEELHQDNWENIPKESLTKKQLWWRKKIFPAYAQGLLGWQLFVLEDKKFTKIIQKLAGPLISKHNYFLKLLFNVRLDEFSKEDVSSYKSMKGGRWSTILNEINDRDVFIINKEEWLEENVLDVDLLIKMWNYRNPDNKI